MLSKITFHISLVFHRTTSVLVALESNFNVMTTSVLEIAQRLILIYLLQLMFEDYPKIIAMSEDNRWLSKCR
jgi:hypothetical protein